MQVQEDPDSGGRAMIVSHKEPSGVGYDGAGGVRIKDQSGPSVNQSEDGTAILAQDWI